MALKPEVGIGAAFDDDRNIHTRARLPQAEVEEALAEMPETGAADPRPTPLDHYTVLVVDDPLVLASAASMRIPTKSAGVSDPNQPPVPSEASRAFR